MTTVCLKTKSSIKAETWFNVFSSFSTDAKSCLFMKQLTSTCVSTILYLRKILSDDFFEAKSFEGMTLMLLKSRANDSYVFKIEEWLEGAFDAIEKKYLKRLMLVIQDAESNKTLEVYTMNFQYNSKKDSKSLFLTTISNKDSEFSVSNTKSNTIKLLQMCYAVTQTYGNLPSKLTLGMRLSYYDNTPHDYEPSGYVAWEDQDPEFPKQARNVEIGITGTQHHLFKLCNKSCLSDKFFKVMEEHLEDSISTIVFEGDNPDVIKEECLSQGRQTQAKKALHFHNTNKNLETHFPVSSKKPEAEPVFVVSEKHPSNAGKSDTGKATVLKDLKKLQVRCSCMFSKKSKSMFSCSNCGFLVHAECFGILTFDPTKKIRFYCHLCHQKGNDYKCHDKVIVNLKNSSDQQKLSILRRVLGHCTSPDVKTITLNKIEKLVGVGNQKNLINIILNKMIEIGVAVSHKKGKSYLIDKNKLANNLPKYFYKIRNYQAKKQVSPQGLRRIDSLKKGTLGLFKTEENMKLPAASQDMIAHNNETVSQQSYDIFC